MTDAGDEPDAGDAGDEPDAGDAGDDHSVSVPGTAEETVLERTDGVWPVALRGVTESVVTTLGPNGRWNVAMLGLHAPGGGELVERSAEPVTARTWGRTRTWRNFDARGSGVVQFVTDPRDVVDAALAIREEAEPVLDSADAWVRVSAEQVDAGEEGGTRWVEWELTPGRSGVRRRRPFTTNRGFYAVVDATVAASRLDVAGYDEAVLVDRLAYFADTVERCGGPREREAFERLDELTGWRERSACSERNESF